MGKWRVTLSAIALFLALAACQDTSSQNKVSGDGNTSQNNSQLQISKDTLSNTQNTGRVIKVRYFYSDSHRCASCKKIEAYTKSAVNESFGAELNSGKIEFSMVDMDKDINKPLVKKYKLFTKSVVLSEFSDGKEVKWQNLEKVWTLLKNRSSFKAYIVQEVKAHL